jgi:hypothetical protein
MHWLKGSRMLARAGRSARSRSPRHRRLITGAGIAVLLASGVLGAGPVSSVTSAKVSSLGEMDCNGFSPVQKPFAKMYCTDIRGLAGIDNANTWGGRFYDNGVYIGHDEPDATFLSNRPASGNDVTWTETLGTDPKDAPTVETPGSDVTHWFELSPAPWFSMAMCDPNSYPQLPCVPENDGNAPACPNAFGCPYNVYPGAGSAFMEMQFYPPGNPPWVDSESCDDTHWCAALNIDSLECTYNFQACNNSCIEPVNFAFITTDGVPSGPAGPRDATLSTFVPGPNTLLMNPGDKITVHMFDAPVPGGGGAKAFKVVIDDLTTGQSGFMQASAKNGFQTSSIVDCSGTPWNFEPEYNTARAGNIVPWAALQTNISTEFETGHFEPCTSLAQQFPSNPFDPLDSSTGYNECIGPYEQGSASSSYKPSNAEGPEAGDAMCYYKGTTHEGFAGAGTSTAPDEVTACQDNTFQNGDLDFDGTPYWADWPTATSPNRYPASFVESLPTTEGAQYSQFFFQTDVALSESTCTGTEGCTVPPSGPGNFYPYWSTATTPGPGDHGPGACSLLFGNVSGADVNDFGKDAQYGANLYSTLGYPEFEGKPRPISTLC